jgi:hypothetical protein
MTQNNTLLQAPHGAPPASAKWRDYTVSRRARLVFDEAAEVAPPEGFSNRETWTATLWLNELAEDGAHIHGWVDELPAAHPDEIRRWFHHRWQRAKAGMEAPFVEANLARIGSLWRIRWEEVATHYKRCPWADRIQETFRIAREVGLPVDRSAQTTTRRRDAIAAFIGRPIGSCRELTADEWTRVGQAIQSEQLSW